MTKTKDTTAGGLFSQQHASFIFYFVEPNCSQTEDNFTLFLQIFSPDVGPKHREHSSIKTDPQCVGILFLIHQNIKYIRVKILLTS